MLDKIARYTDGVLWRLSFSPKGNCLPRSLALYYFATRCGLPVCLTCGVRRTRNTLEGHAWLTLLERPFLERVGRQSPAGDGVCMDARLRGRRAARRV